ncbi:MAG: VOC family protein [Pseudomonadota bacterium]
MVEAAATHGASVTGAQSLSNSFIGDTIQVCTVTRDLKRTVEGFIALGVGPWALYTFSPENCENLTYRGSTDPFSMRVGIANSGTMMWEVIQPLEGKSLYTEFLDAHGEGVHHVGVGCNDMPWDQRIAEFERRGCANVQSGIWRGEVPFAYFETEGLTTTTFEIFQFPPDFVMPEPEEWVPGPPPA